MRLDYLNTTSVSLQLWPVINIPVIRIQKCDSRLEMPLCVTQPSIATLQVMTVGQCALTLRLIASVRLMATSQEVSLSKSQAGALKVPASMTSPFWSTASHARSLRVCSRRSPASQAPLSPFLQMASLNQALLVSHREFLITSMMQIRTLTGTCELMELFRSLIPNSRLLLKILIIIIQEQEFQQKAGSRPLLPETTSSTYLVTMPANCSYKMMATVLIRMTMLNQISLKLLSDMVPHRGATTFLSPTKTALLSIRANGSL